MICMSLAAMSLFLQTTGADFSTTTDGIVVYATEGDVIYVYAPEDESFCMERE